jgi:DNA-binding NarL/FixJ family response regulator
VPEKSGWVVVCVLNGSKAVEGLAGA